MSASSLEASLAEACDTVSQAYADCSQRCEAKIRRAPLTSVLCAAVGGYLLQFFPVRRIITGLIGVLFFLVKPAALLLASFKLLSVLQQTKHAKSVKSATPRKKQTRTSA